ncbi:MAG: DUF881 domain-containing protein [Bowdeniella nasicola]|nr:DUF881 domain-containing protein [Bowdeniella nasicola]
MSPTSWRANDNRGSVSGNALRKLLEKPIDVGYSREFLYRPYLPWHKLAVLLACVVIGATSIWSVNVLTGPNPGNDAARATLEARIQTNLTQLDAIVEHNAQLRAELEEYSQDTLTDGVDTPEEAQVLGAVTAQFRVHGPGLILTLDDQHVTSPEGQLRDYDFHVVINSLWAAGAEAIAINDERIGPTTAIRIAGQAVQVNLKPLVPPYTIEVIGDSTAIQTEFARLRGSAHIAGLRDMYAVSVEFQTVSELTLPPAQQPVLHYVTVEGEDQQQPLR